MHAHRHTRMNACTHVHTLSLTHTHACTLCIHVTKGYINQVLPFSRMPSQPIKSSGVGDRGEQPHDLRVSCELDCVSVYIYNTFISKLEGFRCVHTLFELHKVTQKTSGAMQPNKEALQPVSQK